jgi:4-hydroxy-3-polyprenylbenzoate decarboxylase
MTRLSSTGNRPRVIVGITGASGAVFGVRTLERLREFDVETHLVLTAWGAKTVEHETGRSVKQVKALADVDHRPSDQGATISSGSFATVGMIIAPCSVKTLAAIANGLATDLVARAADVVMKEQRKLVLMVRESPLSVIHLENMLKLARAGVSMLPPMPAFYNRPASVEDIVDHIVTRALDQLGFHSDATPRWDGKVNHSSRPALPAVEEEREL